MTEYDPLEVYERKRLQDQRRRRRTGSVPREQLKGRPRNPRWTPAEDEQVLARAIPDWQLGRKIGRSEAAIICRRVRLTRSQG